MLQHLKHDLVTKEREHSEYSVMEGRILYKGRCVILHNSTVRTVLIREYHDSVTGGNAGELKTYLRLASDWFWVGMRKKVTLYVL